MIEITERCACGRPLWLYENHGAWHVSCYGRCYDPGAEDATPAELLVGWGETPEDALGDYLAHREQLDLEPVYAPSELASFVVPKGPPGWGVSPDASMPARLFFESLDMAERYCSAEYNHGEPQPLYYGPIEAEKAANDV